MNAESKINVHQSSLLGLKAELLRKQAEIQVTKKSDNATTHKEKNKNEKFNEKGKKKKSKKDEEPIEPEDYETMKTFKKSKLMLEAKSRLYEKLTKAHANMNPNFLVDFEHKPDEPKESDDSDIDKECYSDSDSEWVEYTDCFGRTRKCLREDFPKMQEKDEFLKQNVVRKPEGGEEEKQQEKPLYFEDRTPNKESEIDILRRKWEEQTSKLAQKADIHYQDILFDEARSHGVGYYAFSQDDDLRAKQQENLLNLRKETEQKQKENQTAAEIKQKLQQNRLRLARIRKRIRAGLSAEEAEEEENSAAVMQEENIKEPEPTIQSSEHASNDDNITNESDEKSKQESARSKLDDIENKIQAFGELLEKKNKWYVMSQEEWVDKKRKERDSEFAPVYENFQRGEPLNPSELSKHSSIHSNDSDAVGSMPLVTDDSNNTELMQPVLNELDFIGPLPPIINDTKCQLQHENFEKPDTVNIADQIGVGLKFLRQQFEQEHK